MHCHSGAVRGGVFFVPLEDVSQGLWSALFCCLSKVVRCEEEGKKGGVPQSASDKMSAAPELNPGD